MREEGSCLVVGREREGLELERWEEEEGGADGGWMGNRWSPLENPFYTSPQV